MVQVVSCQPFIVEGHIWSQANPSGTCDRKSDTLTGFHRSTLVLPCHFHSTNDPQPLTALLLSYITVASYSFITLPHTFMPLLMGRHTHWTQVNRHEMPVKYTWHSGANGKTIGCKITDWTLANKWEMQTFDVDRFYLKKLNDTKFTRNIWL